MASKIRCHFMYLNKKEKALNNILLQDKISSIVSYHIHIPITTSKKIVKMILYELKQTIIKHSSKRFAQWNNFFKNIIANNTILIVF